MIFSIRAGLGKQEIEMDKLGHQEEMEKIRRKEDENVS